MASDWRKCLRNCRTLHGFDRRLKAKDCTVISSDLGDAWSRLTKGRMMMQKWETESQWHGRVHLEQTQEH